MTDSLLYFSFLFHGELPLSHRGTAEDMDSHSVDELQPREQRSTIPPRHLQPLCLGTFTVISKGCYLGAVWRRKPGETRATVSNQRHGVQKTHFQRESSSIDHQAAGRVQPDAHYTGRPRDTTDTKKPVSKCTSRFHLEYSAQAGVDNRQSQKWHRSEVSWDHQ